MDNILIEETTSDRIRVVLADFDLLHAGATDEVGKPMYRPPEVSTDIQCSASAVDIWSMGVFLYELMMGKQETRMAKKITNEKTEHEQHRQIEMKLKVSGKKIALTQK